MEETFSAHGLVAVDLGILWNLRASRARQSCSGSLGAAGASPTNQDADTLDWPRGGTCPASPLAVERENGYFVFPETRHLLTDVVLLNLKSCQTTHAGPSL